MLSVVPLRIGFLVPLWIGFFSSLHLKIFLINMNFEFSLIGLLFLIMLFVPNILWTRFQPNGYDEFSQNENRVLLALDRIGQVTVVLFSLFCGAKFSFSLLLAIAFILMLLYEAYWIKYFKSITQ